MDPKLIYWTGAWLNMLAIVALAVFGVCRIRQHQVAPHHRRMLTAAWLVAGFLVSYGLKLRFLGREALDTWDPWYVNVLRVHELCVLSLVVAGATALYLAVRLRLRVARDGFEGVYDTAQIPARRRLHRRAGWTALVAAILGILTASVVLFGMYERAGVF